MWRVGRGGINGASCPPASCVSCVTRDTSSDCLGKIGRETWSEKAHHNTDWTESEKVLVSEEFKVNMRKLISTQTVGSIFALTTYEYTRMSSTTHQHHCVGHCCQNAGGGGGGLNENGAGSSRSHLQGSVTGAAIWGKKRKTHLTRRTPVSWRCGSAHPGRLDTSVIASQNCVCSWANLSVHVQG